MSIAGCSGEGGGGNDGGEGGGDGGYLEEASQLDWSSNWQERLGYANALENWPGESRQDVAPDDSPTDWEGREAITSAPWQPPEGWDETSAADVDSIQILNFGSLGFDPATVARHEMVTDRTGIGREYLTPEVNTAIPKQQSFLSAGQDRPTMFNVELQTFTSWVQNGWIAPQDPLWSDGMWEPFPSVVQDVLTSDRDPSRDGTHVYYAPQIMNMPVYHVNRALLEDHGVDPEIASGEWTWSDLETVMGAFQDSDVAGFAHHGANDVYTLFDFLLMVYQQGGFIIQDDGSVQFNTDVGQEALGRMVSWREDGLTPESVISYGQGDLTDVFLAEQAAIIWRWSSFISEGMNQLGDDYYMAKPPAADTGPDPAQRALFNPNLLAINPHASNSEKMAALLFADANRSYPAQWWEYTYEGNLSYANRVYDDAVELKDTLPAWQQEYSGAIREVQELSSVEVWPSMNSTQIRTAEEISLAISGSKSAEKALGDLQAYIDQVLGQ
ncbi:MAG: extracellular solute-binding protein [Natronomonas sp.]|uniref:ABC transporter substrate-binding protein n=1 Tax=Natronomonas sp. TaxID=2184060 RepID=UPI00286FB5DD|nr:extracellular solute-binding protein [Natronomonas sp.]MDR9431909.1 extracellular solute-binding protein [Natronomonas sp.]